MPHLYQYLIQSRAIGRKGKRNGQRLASMVKAGEMTASWVVVVWQPWERRKAKT